MPVDMLAWRDYRGFMNPNKFKYEKQIMNIYRVVFLVINKFAGNNVIVFNDRVSLIRKTGYSKEDKDV